MKFFGLNLILAAIWVFLSGSLTLTTLLFGLLIGFLVLIFYRSILESSRYTRGLWAGLKLSALLAKRLVLANLQLARDILRLRPRFHSSVISYRADALSENELVLLSIIISLTPGTLTIDLNSAEKTLYVHSLYGADEKEQTNQIDQYVKLILQIRHVEQSELDGGQS